MKVELRDGRIVDAPLYDAPPELDAEVRFFIARILVAQEPSEPGGAPRRYGPGGASLEGQSPVRAFVAYDRHGNVMERVGVDG